MSNASLGRHAVREARVVGELGIGVGGEVAGDAAQEGDGFALAEAVEGGAGALEVLVDGLVGLAEGAGFHAQGNDIALVFLAQVALVDDADEFLAVPVGQRREHADQR